MRFLGFFVPSCSFYYATRSNDDNLSNSLGVEALFMRVKPTFVIHLAAKVGGLFANMNDKVDIFEENLGRKFKTPLRPCHKQ
jgi:GDP-L-fucose synthase